jgi:hypothetical protein
MCLPFFPGTREAQDARVFELPSPEGLGFARARLKCRWRERARVRTYTPTRRPIPKLIYEQRSLLICMWHACGIRRSTHTHTPSLFCARRVGVRASGGRKLGCCRRRVAHTFDNTCQSGEAAVYISCCRQSEENAPVRHLFKSFQH